MLVILSISILSFACWMIDFFRDVSGWITSYMDFEAYLSKWSSWDLTVDLGGGRWILHWRKIYNPWPFVAGCQFGKLLEPLKDRFKSNHRAPETAGRLAGLPDKAHPRRWTAINIHPRIEKAKSSIASNSTPPSPPLAYFSPSDLSQTKP